MEKINILEVEHLAHRFAKETLDFDEPIPEFKTRFPHALESCLATPFQEFGGKSAYRGLIGKAAILFYLMIKNHPFQNGNKRVAMMTLLIFLHKNDKWLKVSNQEIYNFAVWVAQSPATLKDAVVGGIEDFLKRYISSPKE
jgi:death on curing protein